MAGARRLDWIDLAASVPLALAVPAAVVLTGEAVMAGAVLAVVLAPAVLAVTAIRRRPRDGVQGSLAVAAYLALAATGGGLAADVLPEAIGLLGFVLLPAFAAALAVRAAIRTRTDASRTVAAASGKSRVPGLAGAGGAAGSAVVGLVRRERDGPAVYPDRPRRRAAVLRLTLVPFLLVLPGAFLILLVVATTSASEPPLYADEGTVSFATATFALAAIHAGGTVVRAAVARWRDGRIHRAELRWALAHGVAWAGVWLGLGLDSRLLGSVATLAVLATAVSLARASVAAVRETEPESRASA